MASASTDSCSPATKRRTGGHSHRRLTGCFEAAPTLDRTRHPPWARPRRRPRRAAGRGCGCPVPTSRAGRPARHTPHRAWPRAPRAPREARRRDVGRGRRTMRAAPIAPGIETTPVGPTRLPPPLLPGRPRPNPEPAKAHSIVRLLRLLALAGRPRSPRCSPVLIRYMFGENKNKGNRCLRNCFKSTGNWLLELVTGNQNPRDASRKRDEHPEGSSNQ